MEVVYPEFVQQGGMEKTAAKVKISLLSILSKAHLRNYQICTTVNKSSQSVLNNGQFQKGLF